MSDILLHAAIQENQRLVSELMTAKDKIAKKESLQAAGVSPTVTDECNMFSIQMFGYAGHAVENLCNYPRIGRSGYVIPRYFKPENLEPVNRMCAINDMYCKTFGTMNQPRQNGIFTFDCYDGRCGGQCSWTVPTGVCRVTIQLWGPGGGSGGACCQGSGMPGANGAYSIQELNVTPGDTMCWCYACAYCCYGDGTSQAGGGNGYCTNLCYCDCQTQTGHGFWAWDAPSMSACRHNCMWCMAHNYNNCCNFHIGGNWYLVNGEDIQPSGGCQCSFGAQWSCNRGLSSCGNWGFCVNGPGNSAIIPMMYDHYCGFGTDMSREKMRDKNAVVYGHYAVWPGVYLSSSCCVGTGWDGSPSYIEQAPVVGWPESWWVDGSRHDYMAGIKIPPARCCDMSCFGALHCHGIQKAPGIGGNARWNMSEGRSCGEYGGGGAVCVSWDYYC